MMKRWVAVAFFFPGLLIAAEYEYRGLKFIGDAETIAAFAAAAVKHDAAKKLSEALGKRGGLEHIAARNQADAEWVAARDQMFRIGGKLKIVPAGKPGADKHADMPEDFMEDCVSMRLQRKNPESAADIAWLEDMLPAWRNHRGEDEILIQLALLYKEKPEVALKYYQQATRCKAYSDRWKFSQQRAWQEIARIHEANKEFPKAIKALSQWKIEEPCGNGRAASRIRRTFWVWRLRRSNGEKEDALRQEIWQSLLDGKLHDVNGPEQSAKEILQFYGDDTKSLKQDAEKALEAASKTEGPNRKIIAGHAGRVIQKVLAALEKEKPSTK